MLADMKGYDYHKLADVAKQLESDFSVTYIKDGRIIGFFGIFMQNDIGYPWLVPTIYLDDKCIDFCKSIKTYLKRLPETFNLTRYETNGQNDDKIIRWLTWLGFTKQNDIYVRQV